MLKISVIYGSHRIGRQGIKVAKFVCNSLKNQGHDVEFVDALEYNLPLLDKMYKEYSGDAPLNLEKLHKIFEESDVFVVVSGEYNHSIPPGLKNILDYFQSEYFYKPAGIVSYSAGSFGGVRASVHLRAILGELGMVSIPTIFPVSKVQDSFDDEGNDLTFEKDYERRFEKFVKELEWYGYALKNKRD